MFNDYHNAAEWVLHIKIILSSCECVTMPYPVEVSHRSNSNASGAEAKMELGCCFSEMQVRSQTLVLCIHPY